MSQTDICTGQLTLLKRMKIIQSDKFELLPERLVKTVAAKLKEQIDTE